jgi:ankyrin repeat protein
VSETPSSLPPRPSLEWLRKTAKERLSKLRETDPAAKLATAQLAIAREHGFASWRKLKAHIESPPPAPQPQVPTSEQIIAAFLERVGTGQIDIVRAALDAAPALVNAVGPHPFWGGRPQPLHLAIEGKRRELFDLLLERGADVNGRNDGYDLWSPLMLAISNEQEAMKEELLRRGARVGLLEALMMGDDARVGELLNEGQLPDIAPNGGSILAFAKTTWAADRLLELGAKTDVKDRWGSTPIDAISRMGPRGQELVKHLISRGIAAAPKEYARLDDRATLARLIEADPSVARLDSVMMAAVDFGHHELVEWLVARGGNVQARAEAQSRHTALHSAAWNGDLRMVQLLIANGADPNARDEQYDGTPFGWAETSIEITNNAKCAAVAEYLRPLTK